MPVSSSPTVGPAPATPPSTQHGGEAAVELLVAAQDSLAQARWAGTLAQRYDQTRLGVLRAAAAVLARRGGARRGGRPTSVWALLPRVAPELTEWAQYFAAALTEGPGPSSPRAADDLLRDGEQFAQAVARVLGVAGGPGRPADGSPIVPVRLVAVGGS